MHLIERIAVLSAIARHKKATYFLSGFFIFKSVANFSIYVINISMIIESTKLILFCTVKFYTYVILIILI